MASKAVGAMSFGLETGRRSPNEVEDFEFSNPLKFARRSPPLPADRGGFRTAARLERSVV